MPDVMKMEIRGLQELQRKMEQVVADISGGELLEGMRDATLFLSRAVKQNMAVDWHDTGRSMSSVTPKVVLTTREIEGVVGSNVTYVPYGEFGTGIYRDTEGARDLMAKTTLRVSGRLRKGGIRPRRMFRNAIRDNRDKIQRMIEGVVAKVVRK